jgi:hypothetical protein
MSEKGQATVEPDPAAGGAAVGPDSGTQDGTRVREPGETRAPAGGGDQPPAPGERSLEDMLGRIDPTTTDGLYGLGSIPWESELAGWTGPVFPDMHVGTVTFWDGDTLTRDRAGHVRYTSHDGRTAVWTKGNEWVDEATRIPMPDSFETHAPTWEDKPEDLWTDDDRADVEEADRRLREVISERHKNAPPPAHAAADQP